MFRKLLVRLYFATSRGAMSRVVAAHVLAASLVLMASPAAAQRWFGPPRYAGGHAYPAPRRAAPRYGAAWHGPQAYDSYTPGGVPASWATARGANAAAAYPQYIGGFHARYFDNYGVPSGDIGLRGNGIYVTPW